MSSPFSIPRGRCSILSDPTLRAEIQSHTGNPEETASILRSIGRFGEDVSIRSYEMTPVTGRRGYHTTVACSWTVRAVR